MRKTGGQIEADFFDMVKASSLAQSITGTIYKSGMRPIDQKTEDAVISFLTGVDAQVQSGVVNLNIYVPDIDNGGGQFVKNTARCRQLEIEGNEFVQGTKPGSYRISLAQIIQTFKAEDASQHFVNVKIRFELTTF